MAAAALPAAAGAQASAQDSAVGNVTSVEGTFPGLTAAFDACSGPLEEAHSRDPRLLEPLTRVVGPLGALA
jgi:hypothetical protein